MKINSTINLTPAYKIRKEKTSQTYRQCVVPALLHELLLLLEDLPDGPGDDPALRVLLEAGSPLHGVGLAAASLSVGEHTDVVAVQCGLKENTSRHLQKKIFRRPPEQAVRSPRRLRSDLRQDQTLCRETEN